MLVANLNQPGPTPTTIMSNTLVLLFHPDLSRSRANAALRSAAASLDGVDVIDMHVLYPDGHIDTATEVARLLAADRIVLQFPVQWYSVPPLLRAWQDAVLTRMYYLAYEQEGRHLEGTPILIAATAGNRPEAYSAEGMNRFPLEDLLLPLQATAHRCGLPWSPPFLVYCANKLDDFALGEAATRYASHLRNWIGETS